MRQGHQERRDRSSRAWWLLGAVAVVVVGTGVWAFVGESGTPAPSPPTTIAAAGTSRVALRETRATLAPAKFVGKAAVTHQIARDMPDVLDQLYCYCECDKSIGHKSLLSCYTDGHAAT